MKKQINFKKPVVYVLFIAVLLNYNIADSIELTEQINNQKAEAEKTVDPIVQEVAHIEQVNAEAQLELEMRKEQKKQLESKIEETYKTIQTHVTGSSIQALMLNGKTTNKIGNCKIEAGRELNEYYLFQENKKILVTFAQDNTSHSPVAHLYKNAGSFYIEVLQKEFNPEKPDEANGPMKALIRYEEKVPGEIKIVHAQFQGQAIGDTLGIFSSKKLTAFTCLNMDEESVL